jgi:hypothetical protein
VRADQLDTLKTTEGLAEIVAAAAARLPDA